MEGKWTGLQANITNLRIQMSLGIFHLVSETQSHLFYEQQECGFFNKIRKENPNDVIYEAPTHITSLYMLKQQYSTSAALEVQSKFDINLT